MKRLILILLCLLALVLPATALSLNFQTTGDLAYISQVTSPGHPGSVTYTYSATGGNSYVSANVASSGYPQFEYIINGQSMAMTYSAATILPSSTVWGGSNSLIRLYDSNFNIMWSGGAISHPSSPFRIEVKIVGGQAYVYQNGVLRDTSGVLAVNPYYIGYGEWDQYGGFGGGHYDYDDMIWGDTENKFIFGGPDYSNFEIVRDMITPANSGLAHLNGIVISSYNMTTEYGYSNLTAPFSYPVVLQSVSSGSTGTVYGTYTTTSAAGTIAWPLVEDLFLTNAPYGIYYTTIQGSGKISNEIAYVANGASVAWGSKTYSQNDYAPITYAVSSGGYWDLTKYTYKIGIMDAYGSFVKNISVTSQTGTTAYQFTTSNTAGVYYAEFIATPISGGSDILMNFDYTTVSGYVKYSGWVNNAQTCAVISGANVSMVGSSTVNVLSAADGNYTASGFLTGTSLAENVTASGYRQFKYTFTPLAAKSISLNISLVPNNPTETGSSIGGVDRDSTYGNPIPGATVYVVNNTYGTIYIKTTNNCGWYLCDAGSSCYLTSSRAYSVWAAITGYANSGNYSVVAP